jgi:hypothetical protein
MLEGIHGSAIARRLMIVALAGAWVGLGFTSDNVPMFNEDVWVVLCTMCAGAALALARWRSAFALRSYILISVSIGILRSAAYADEGLLNPMFVWAIVTLTTVIAYYAVTARVERYKL